MKGSSYLAQNPCLVSIASITPESCMPWVKNISRIWPLWGSQSRGIFAVIKAKYSLDKTTRQSVAQTCTKNADITRGRSRYYTISSTQLTFHVVHDLQGRYWRRPEPQSVYYWLWPQPQSGSIGYNRNLSSGSIGCLPRMPYTVFSHRPVGVGCNLEGCEVHSLGMDVI